MRWIKDRLFAREIVRTNWLGAETTFRVGEVYRGARITRHEVIRTAPWATIIVYGR